MNAGAVLRALTVATTVALVAVLAACAPTGSDESADAPAAGGLDDFSFESLDVDYTLSRADDGTSRLLVVESFVALFPDTDQNRGMRRSIPDSYNGQPLRPELISVTDGEGAPRDAETDDDDGVWSVLSREDDYVHGAQTYVFTYELSNVTWSFADTDADEFYWDVNGVDWSQDFGRISAELHVDPPLVTALTGDAFCYAGAQGETATCPAEIDTETGVVSVSAADVAPHETVTMAVGFEPDTFARFDDRYLASGWGWFQASAFLVLLAGLAWAIVTRRRALADAPGRGVVVAQYDPPADIDALTSAVLLGRTTKAVPAEVLEQAVRGSIRIEEGPPKRFGHPPLRAVLVDPSRADNDGAQLLTGLFGDDPQPGAEFTFGSSDTRFSSAAQKLLSWAAADLKRRGVYRPVRPGTRALPGAVLAIGAGATILGGVMALTADVFPAIPLLGLIAALALATVSVVVLAHRPLSPYGTETREHLDGLRLFIDWAEADRIRFLQSPDGAERRSIGTTDAGAMLAIYEPLLPYAVVFGLEKKWAEQLAVYYENTSAPGWYAGAAAFNVNAFATGIGSLSATAVSSSSTAGGSSGGGAAGGGGGGGGGGGA